MEDNISQFSEKAQKIVNTLQEDLKGMRSGRANSAMIEGIAVQAYGSSMKLRELSTIMTEGPSVLVIVPFDPSTVKDIEKGILASPIGINPQTEGNKLYIRIPQLSEEQREKYIKLVSGQIEDAKNLIRYERDNIRKKIKSQEDSKTISEDEKYRMEKEIDLQTTSFMSSLQVIRDRKEKEIREV